MENPKCLACDTVAGKIHPPGGIIHRDNLWIVDHAVGLKPNDPIPFKGFLIICPVRHVNQVSWLTDEEQTEFGLLLKDVATALTRVMQPEKIYVCSFGEQVEHVHWYVIPRSADMPKNGLEVLEGIVRRRRWLCTLKEAASVAVRVKSELEALVKMRQGSPDLPYSSMF